MWGLALPMNFWWGPSWQVVLEAGNPMLDCPFPLISETGEYLVLLSDTSPASSRTAAMEIYREPSRTDVPGTPRRGLFVKDLTLRDLWGEKDYSDLQHISESWLEKGSFEWGTDHHSLVYKTPWKCVVHIDVNTGAVSNDSRCIHQRP
jgi:hypothetical protein